MASQKNSDLKYCIKCKILLTDENWKTYLKARSQYYCWTCLQAKNKAEHDSDPEYNNKQLARSRLRKSAVIFAYGNTCNNCFENEYEKLTIDHINNDGYIHRAETSINIYDFLYNNKILDGYQILCYNCNCSKNVKYKDKYALRDKKKVLKHYGEECNECGEYRVERLTIDHNNNDGNIQRKELLCYTGVRMYRWLIKNNFPNDLGLQVLCFNCNCSKRSKNNRKL